MTNIAVLVDGSGEEQALNELIPTINRMFLSSHRLLNAGYVDIQPKATAAQIVKKATNRVVHLSRKADKVIILIDFEDREGCLVEWCRELRGAFHRREMSKVEVVIKNRKFENWLIADPDNIHKKNGYEVSSAKKRQVAPGKADNVSDAEKWLNECKKKGSGSYHKTQDAKAFCKTTDVSVVKKNSRSFRKFAKECGF